MECVLLRVRFSVAGICEETGADSELPQTLAWCQEFELLCGVFCFVCVWFCSCRQFGVANLLDPFFFVAFFVVVV